MTPALTYIDVIGESFQTVQAIVVGNAETYEALQHVGGDPLPDKATLDVLILQNRQTYVWQQIQAERTRRQNGGYYVAAVNKWFHSDSTSRIQQLGLLMMGANMPSGIMWKTMDGSFVEMTPALAGAIFQAAGTHDMTAFAVAEQHRAAMLASSDPMQYVFSGGWPAIF